MIYYKVMHSQQLEITELTFIIKEENYSNLMESEKELIKKREMQSRSFLGYRNCPGIFNFEEVSLCTIFVIQFLLCFS